MVFRSLRVRLAVWALLLLGLSQLLVGVIFYTFFSSWLESQIDTSLQLTAAQVSSVLRDRDEIDEPLELDEINFELDEGNFAVRGFVQDQQFFIRLINRNTGTVIVSSTDIDIPVQVDSVFPAEHLQTIAYVEGDNAIDVRVFTLPLTYAPEYALQTGISLEETQEILDVIFLTLTFLIVVTAVVAPLSGWFLANRALVPVRAIAHTAADINETGLTRRLQIADAEVELVDLVQAFNGMLARLEAAFQRQRQFTSDAAHELRTPLSIMQTGLEVTLNEKRDAEEYREALTVTLNEVERLTRLTNTLLMLARTDNPDFQPGSERVDFTLLLNSVADQFDVIAGEKRLAFEREIAPDIALVGDETRLIQLALNLVDNAVKYTPDGGRVSLGAVQADDSVRVTVANTGTVIPPADRERIFERFYRADPARSRSQGSFGLGLAIVKQIVDRHGGQIDLTSDVDRGTAFVVTLPAG